MHTLEKETNLFELGRFVITATAQGCLNSEDAFMAVLRHTTGDWGDLCEEDRRANDQALSLGGRLLSAYLDRDETVFWVISKADRSATTILLPSDY